MSENRIELNLKGKWDKKTLEDLRVKSRGQKKVLLNMILTE